MTDYDATTPPDDLGTPGELQPLPSLFGEVFDLAEQVSAQISDAEIRERLNKAVRDSRRQPSKPEASGHGDHVQHSGDHVPHSKMVPLELQAGEFVADNLRWVLSAGASESDCRRLPFDLAVERAYRAETQAAIQILAEARQYAEAARRDAERTQQALLEARKAQEQIAHLLAEARNINEAATEQAAAIVSTAQETARALIRETKDAAIQHAPRTPGWRSPLAVPGAGIVATADRDLQEQYNQNDTFAVNVPDLLDPADAGRAGNALRRYRAQVRAFREGPQGLTRPDPADATTAAEFRQMLAEFRDWSVNPSFRAIASRRSRVATHSTLHRALSGSELPSLEVVLAVVMGCGGSDDDTRQWLSAWRQIRSQQPQPEDPHAYSLARADSASSQSG